MCYPNDDVYDLVHEGMDRYLNSPSADGASWRTIERLCDRLAGMQIIVDAKELKFIAIELGITFDGGLLMNTVRFAQEEAGEGIAKHDSIVSINSPQITIQECPNCDELEFTVTAEELKIAGGWIECDRCAAHLLPKVTGQFSNSPTAGNPEWGR